MRWKRHYERRNYRYKKKIDYLYNKLDEICDDDFEEKNNQVSFLMKEIDKQRMKLLEAELKQVYREIEDENS